MKLLIPLHLDFGESILTVTLIALLEELMKELWDDKFQAKEKTN